MASSPTDPLDLDEGRELGWVSAFREKRVPHRKVAGPVALETQAELPAVAALQCEVRSPLARGSVESIRCSATVQKDRQRLLR